MSRRARRQAAILAGTLATALAVGAPGHAAVADTAADLLARVMARQQTSGFTMRARLIIQPAGAGRPAVTLQIRALGRQDTRGRRVLYQALWPDAVKGRAVVVDRVQGQPITGFFFEPPETMTPISPQRLTEPVLESDLTVEDLVDDFQWWPNPVFAGQGTVDGRACRLVESRPPAGAHSSYAVVRSCISESALLIVRVEKLGVNGRVVKRVTVTRTARAGNGVITPRALTIEDLTRGSTTTIDVSRGDRDIVVATAEFSPARLRSLGR